MIPPARRRARGVARPRAVGTAVAATLAVFAAFGHPAAHAAVDAPVTVVAADPQLRNAGAGVTLAADGTPLWTSLNPLDGDPAGALNLTATTNEQIVAGQPQPAPVNPGRVFVAPEGGSGKPAVIVPDNWTQSPAANGKGTVYTNPANPNEQIRIMESGKYNPDGYVRNRDNAGRYLGADGKPLTGPDGKPVTGKNDPAAHVDVFYRGLLQWFPKLRSFPFLLLPGQQEMLDNLQRCGTPTCGPRTETSLPQGHTLLADASGPNSPLLVDLGGAQDTQIEGYPLALGGTDLIGNLDSSPYLQPDSPLALPTYSFDADNTFRVDSFDKGVNFQDIRFVGMVLDPASRAPFFRADVVPVADPAAAGLGAAELQARTARFKQYFTEGVSMPQSDIHISVESAIAPDDTRSAAIVLPEPLRRTSAARVMVADDIKMKRDYLATVARGAEETVNDGITGMWNALLATSPNYTAWLLRGLPTIDVDARALIVGAPATVTRGTGPADGGGHRITAAPLDLQTFLDRCEAGLPPGYEQDAAEVQALRATVCAQITDRMAALRPAFVDKLNTAAEYAELRLVYNAMAHAKLYKDLTSTDPATPYDRYRETGVLPPDAAVPGEFPEAELLAQVTTAGTDRYEVPCGDDGGVPVCAPPGSFEVFGGVDWSALTQTVQPMTDPVEVTRTTASTTAAVRNPDGSYTLNLGTALPDDLPEYVAGITGDPRAGSAAVSLRNVGRAAPASSYLQVFDVALGADGAELARTPVHTAVSPPAAPGGPAVDVPVACPSCATPVAGAVRRLLVASVALGQQSGQTFTVEAELNARNDVGLEFANG